MEQPPETSREIRSKEGLVVTIMPYEDAYFDSLVAMYDTYEPLGSVQGLPPLDETRRHLWVQEMVSNGMNFLALHNGAVIGHASLFSMPANWAEYFIFVHQDFQRQGIGTAVSLFVIDWARREKLSTIWLTVEKTNYIAISLYRKVGFTRIGSSEDSWEMILTLGDKKDDGFAKK